MNVDGKEPAQKIEEKVVIKGTRSLRKWHGGGDRALGPRKKD